MKFLLLALIPLLIASCGGEKKSKSVQLSEDIQMNAAIYSNQIQLSNVLQSSSLTMNICGPTPQPGKIYNYVVVNNILTLSDQRIQVSYQSVVNNGGIYGTWKMVSTTDPELKSGSVEITSNSVRFISTCKGQ